jgi:hypothetical protein
MIWEAKILIGETCWKHCKRLFKNQKTIGSIKPSFKSENNKSERNFVLSQVDTSIYETVMNCFILFVMERWFVW